MRAICVLFSTLVFAACGEGPAVFGPDGATDAGTMPDASMPDTEPPDTGAPDAALDTGANAADSEPDSGTLDTGAPDSDPDGGDGGCGPDVLFASQVQPIFNACINCHPSGGGLNLLAGQSHASLVNKATAACGGARIRVIPGDPANSYLMAKITGVNKCSGNKMGNLNAAELALVQGWICEGAPNN
jgi:hypothetical protein